MPDKMTHQSPTCIELIGDATEAFYQLGLKDQDTAKNTFHHLLSMIHPTQEWKMLDTFIEEALKKILDTRLQFHNSFEQKIKAYAEGVKLEYKDLVLCMLLPEIMSSLSYWIPKIPMHFLPFGCSSYFAFNAKNQQLMHGRILDFPLVNSFDKHERLLLTKWSQSAQVLSIGSSGFPYPSITAMSSHGLSFALHQKFCSTFNPNGTSIFEILDQVIEHSRNIEDVIEILSRYESLTSWGIHIGEDTPGRAPRVLELDIIGKQIEYQIYTFDDHNKEQVLYFHNKMINKDFEQKKHLPYGLEGYNQMRYFCGKKKINRLKKIITSQKNGLNEKKFLKEITALDKLSHQDFSKWRMDSITPSSLQAVVMTPSQGNILKALGEGPKINPCFAYSTTDIWNHQFNKSKIIPLSKTQNELQQLRQKGWRELMLAQSSFDLRDYHSCYHHIQMSKDFFDQAKTCESLYPEFYFLVLQFIFDQNRKVRFQLLHKFRQLDGKLPNYLNDHCRLFITRLESILDLEPTFKEYNFSNLSLRHVYQYERKISKYLIHSIISSTINIRMDMVDIIYPHCVIKASEWEERHQAD